MGYFKELAILKEEIENRWCAKHSYIMAVKACRARAEKQQACRVCLKKWTQSDLPLMVKTK